MYSESIEKLKGVLQAMQNASQKRERLEKQLREQLQSEINQLKGGGGAGRTNSKVKETQAIPAELQQQILMLETDVAKVCCRSLSGKGPYPPVIIHSWDISISLK